MACKLRSVPPEFEGRKGESVTLFTKDAVGSVLFKKAEYAGKQLVPEGETATSIKFEIVEGRKTLRMVFAFSESSDGEGELRERCGGGESQLIRELAGHEPAQNIKIVGK